MYWLSSSTCICDGVEGVRVDVRDTGYSNEGVGDVIVIKLSGGVLEHCTVWHGLYCTV